MLYGIASYLYYILIGGFFDLSRGIITTAHEMKGIPDHRWFPNGLWQSSPIILLMDHLIQTISCECKWPMNSDVFSNFGFKLPQLLPKGFWSISKLCKFMSSLFTAENSDCHLLAFLMILSSYLIMCIVSMFRLFQSLGIFICFLVTLMCAFFSSHSIQNGGMAQENGGGQ